MAYGDNIGVMFEYTTMYPVIPQEPLLPIAAALHAYVQHS